MKIWLINHYAVPPQYYPLARPSIFARKLIEMGHEVTIIAASSVHNSQENLIRDSEKVRTETVDGVPYVYIKCIGYQGNGLRRVLNILQFAYKLPGVCRTLEQPDAIVATSFDPLTCYQGIMYAKKNGIKAIAEIADLWPETLVAYTKIGSGNPIVRILRAVEKRMYTKADAIVFTMEGAYDYILEQKWERKIPKSKVYLINNGIDVEQFDYNRAHFQIDDMDLNNKDIFKVVYTGAIRKVNNLDILLNVAKCVKNPQVRFLVWGDGDELPRLQKRLQQENIQNVIFKGRAEKKFIPYITSKADLNFVHNESSPLFRFGISFNKIFDYMAAGKPILSDVSSKYSPISMNQCGVDVESADAEVVADAICQVASWDENEYAAACKKAREAALLYDFNLLTKKLAEIIDSV